MKSIIRWLRDCIRKILNSLPDQGLFIRNIRWWLYLRTINIRNILNPNKRNSLKFDPDKIIWVNPSWIEHTVAPSNAGNGRDTSHIQIFHALKDAGHVIGGDWDQYLIPFEELDVFRAIQVRIMEKRKWEDTDFYSRVLGQIKSGNFRFNCENETDWKARCQYTDELIQSIQEKGYLQSKHVSIVSENKNLLLKRDEITCNIGRGGELIFHDGRHRLAIAKVLGIDRVPVKIVVRHERWAKFRNLIELLAKKQNGRLYQPLLHPDLADVPAHHGCERRFEAISERLNSTDVRVLDLGANLFYFCQRFEELGASCTGVELNSELVHVAERIKFDQGMSFETIQGSFLASPANKALSGKKFEVVLALNIFHHFLKEEEEFLNLKNWLKRFGGNFDSMFFEPHNVNEAQMRNAYRNFGEGEFVEFVCANCGFTQYESIHATHDDRVVYHLWR